MTDVATPEQVAARAELVKALRSGDYLQGHGYLAQKMPNNTLRLCCLGVACIIAQAGQKEENGVIIFGKEGDRKTTHMPTEVMDYFGFTKRSGSFYEPILTKGGRFNSLVDLNDDARFTFAEIADVIEREPRGLFVHDKPADIDGAMAVDSDTDPNDH